MIEPNKDLTAVGRLAGRLGCPVDVVLELAERLGVEPAMRVDKVTFFDRAGAERIADGLAGKQTSKPIERLIAGNELGDRV